MEAAQLPIPPGLVKLLYELGDSEEPHLITFVTSFSPESDGQMGLSRSRGPCQNDVL